jgi:hypothetical protein
LQNACTRPQTGQCSQCVQLLAKWQCFQLHGEKRNKLQFIDS